MARCRTLAGMRSTSTETLVRLPDGRLEWHLDDGRTAPFIFGSDGDDAPEPQSVTDIAPGTLSRIAAEGEAAPESEVPVADEPELVAPDEPVLEEPDPIAEPELGTEAPEAGADPAADDPFSEFGGKDTVQAALRLYEASRTEDGVIQLFLEAGKQLGVGLDKIEALFTGEQASAPAAPAGEQEYDYEKDPDRPVTLRELEERERQRQEQAAAAERQAKLEQSRQAASQVVNTTIEELGVKMQGEDGKPNPVAEVILQLGNKHLPAGTLDPTAIANAVRRGHADYLALVEQERQAYAASKRKAAESVPSAPAGAAAPSAPAPAEPKDTAEAIKLARQRLREAGAL